VCYHYAGVLEDVMPLGSDQIAFIQTLDHKDKQILRHGGEDEVASILM